MGRTDFYRRPFFFSEEMGTADSRSEDEDATESELAGKRRHCSHSYGDLAHKDGDRVSVRKKAAKESKKSKKRRKEKK